MLKLTLLIFLSLFLFTKVLCCPIGCATCSNNTKSYNYSTNACYSCNSNYFLYSYYCYSCSSCSYYAKCSSCFEQDSSSLSQAVVIILVVIIISLVLFGFLINYCCKNRALAANQGQDQAESLHSASRLVRGNPQLSNIDLKVKWVHAERRLNNTQVCSICCDNNVYLLTQCNHYFHPNCILEWAVKRQGDCPLCKAKKLFPAKVYCQKCYREYYEGNAQSIAAARVQQMWKTCQSCKDLAL